MELILIQASNEAEARLIHTFLETHKIKNRVLTEEDKEDIVLAKMMEETDYESTMDTDSFLRQLRG